jgi:uncharacterized membrane-anchored protein
MRNPVMTRMKMSAFFVGGHTNISSHVEDDRNAYGIILLAICYPEVAAFLMFALATRLSQMSESRSTRDAHLKISLLTTTKVGCSR